MAYVEDSFGDTRMTALSKGGHKQHLTDEEKRELQAFLNGLEVFLDISKTIPLTYLRSFLLVALDEGESVTTYGNRAGLPQPVMSRHLLDLGERNRHKEPGFGLVQSKNDPMELRRSIVSLSNTGAALARRLGRVLKGGK